MILKRGDFVTNILTNKVGMILERYHYNFNPYYADWSILFEDGSYEVVRERHLRTALFGEKIRWLK